MVHPMRQSGSVKNTISEANSPTSNSEEHLLSAAHTVPSIESRRKEIGRLMGKQHSMQLKLASSFDISIMSVLKVTRSNHIYAWET